MKKSLFAVLSATPLLAGCLSDPGQMSLTALQAECNTGKTTSCAAVGRHPKVICRDAVVAGAVEMALRDAVAVGMARQRNGQLRYYAQENRADRQR